MHDVAIIGGSFAGLTAALQLGRASRSVVVIDAGRPRNRTSPAAHGVPGWDGALPATILGRFRSDLAAYPSVRLVGGRVASVEGEVDRFGLVLDGGDRVEARRVVLAHGVEDILPAIPGLAEAWGRTVLHCPYCHGYEVKGRPLAVLARSPVSAHQALMLRADWSPDVTLFTGVVDGLELTALQAAGVRTDTRPIHALAAADDGLDLALADGTGAHVAALFVAPATSLRGSPAEAFGCAVADGPMGPFVRVGAMAQTSIAGVFAAGDVARAAPNINFALGDGTQAGLAVHASLLFPGLVAPLETSS